MTPITLDVPGETLLALKVPYAEIGTTLRMAAAVKLYEMGQLSSDEYGLRFDLEENFLDDKSNGFQVEASRWEEPEALERLFLVLAVATFHFTSVGIGVVQTAIGIGG